MSRRLTMAQIQPATTYERLLYTTVRLEFKLVDDKEGFGTGFFYDHYTAGGDKIPLLVTNKHVIKDSLSVKARFHQRDTAAQTWAVSGEMEIAFPLLESAWTGGTHPVEGEVLIPSTPPISTQSMIPANLGLIVKAKEVATLASHLEGTSP